MRLSETMEKRAEEFVGRYKAVRDQLGRVIVGHDDIVPLLPNVVDSGPESDLWEGRTGYVIRALSLVPDEVRHMLDLLYVHYLNNNQIWNVKDSPQGTLSRSQTEVVAARVSALNDCFY